MVWKVRIKKRTENRTQSNLFEKQPHSNDISLKKENQ